jgi:serine/threonine protein kinase
VQNELSGANMPHLVRKESRLQNAIEDAKRLHLDEKNPSQQKKTLNIEAKPKPRPLSSSAIAKDMQVPSLVTPIQRPLTPTSNMVAGEVTGGTSTGTFKSSSELPPARTVPVTKSSNIQMGDILEHVVQQTPHHAFEVNAREPEPELLRIAFQQVSDALGSHPSICSEQDHQRALETTRLESLDHFDVPLKRLEKDIKCFYSHGKVIGKGTFGKVTLARHRITGECVAIKSYFREKGAISCTSLASQELPSTTAPGAITNGGGNDGKASGIGTGGEALDWKRVRQEVKMMASLHPHPSIIRYFEAFETPTQMHLVMEYVNGGNLVDLLKKFPDQRLPEAKAKWLFMQICCGVASLHEQNVIHRDLKLENVLLDQNQERPKLIDFGFSMYEENFFLSSSLSPPLCKGKKKIKEINGGVSIPRQLQKNFCGTPSYMAPEVLVQKFYDGKAVDCWSLGVILYVMLCGKFPFYGKSYHQLYQNIRSTNFSMPRHVSKEAQDLLSCTFVLDASKRLTLRQIQVHPWLKSLMVPDSTSIRPPPLFPFYFYSFQDGRNLLINKLESLGFNEKSLLIQAFTKDKRNALSVLIDLCLFTAEKKYHELEIAWLENGNDPLDSIKKKQRKQKTHMDFTKVSTKFSNTSTNTLNSTTTTTTTTTTSTSNSAITTITRASNSTSTKGRGGIRVGEEVQYHSTSLLPTSTLILNSQENAFPTSGTKTEANSSNGTSSSTHSAHKENLERLIGIVKSRVHSISTIQSVQAPLR